MEFLKRKILNVIILGGIFVSGCGPPPPIILDEFSDTCEWNHGGGSPQRSSYLNIETTGQPELAWVKKFPLGLNVEPTTYDGVLVIPLPDKKVHIISANNGQNVAEIKFRKPLLTPVVIADSIAVFNVGGKNLVISKWLSRDDVWEVELNGSNNEPLIMDGKVYWIDGLNYLRCSELSSGKRIWDKHLSGFNRIPLAGSGDFVVSVIDRNNIECLDSNDGSVIWSYSVNGNIRTSPVIENGYLIYSTVSGTIGRLDLYTGDEIWINNLDTDLSAPLGSDGQNVLIGTLDGELISLDASTGDFNWISRVGGPVIAGPTLTDDLAVFVSLDYNIYFTDKQNGDFRYVHKTNGILSTRPIACEGNVYVAGEDKNLYCFQLSEEY